MPLPIEIVIQQNINKRTITLKMVLCCWIWSKRCMSMCSIRILNLNLTPYRKWWGMCVWQIGKAFSIMYKAGKVSLRTVTPTLVVVVVNVVFFHTYCLHYPSLLPRRCLTNETVEPLVSICCKLSIPTVTSVFLPLFCVQRHFQLCPIFQHLSQLSCSCSRSYTIKHINHFYSLLVCYNLLPSERHHLSIMRMKHIC